MGFDARVGCVVSGVSTPLRGRRTAGCDTPLDRHAVESFYLPCVSPGIVATDVRGFFNEAPAAVAFPVGPLPVAVIEPSFPTLLVPPVGGPPLARALGARGNSVESRYCWLHYSFLLQPGGARGTVDER